MRTVRDIRRRNVELIIDQLFEGKAVGLARAMKITEAELSRARRGTAGRGISDKFARKIERAIGKPMGWLDSPRTPGAQSRLEDVTENLASSNVPLLDWAEALDASSARGKPTRYISVSPRLGDRQQLFALRVRGDSMESMTGGPSFPDGCVIVVDPNKPHKHGDFVVVQEPGNPEATLKQYQENPGATYLKPLNPQYEPTRFTPEHRIVGVVVSMQYEF